MTIETVVEKIAARCGDLNIPASEHYLWVRVGEQKLYHIARGACRKVYTVSTSRKPPSCIENSQGTPLGLHRVAKKIGDGAPEGMVFKGRVATGQCYWECAPEEQEKNLITTRILWLEGLEDGHNRGPGRDTFARYVYIHGTNQEDRIGTPNSHGCVLLRNAEVVELFDTVPEGALVLVEL